AQSTLDRSLSVSSWPVTTANDEAMPRCVSGIPAYAATATAELTPGTTSNGIPACASASASSPPLPKTNGSPPLSRTTRRPRGAAASAGALADVRTERAPPGVSRDGPAEGAQLTPDLARDRGQRRVLSRQMVLELLADLPGEGGTGPARRDGDREVAPTHEGRE